MESKFGSKVHIMDHPLVAHKLTIMRDKNTSVKDFRELVSEIGMLITYEATRDLPLTTKHIETPICEMDAPTLAGRKFVVVPILRAGLGLVDGVLRMVPSARVGHIGMYRDEETLEPHPYFCKMPKDVAERDVLIVDPMLATGGSAAEAIGEMKKRGCKHIKLMVLVAAPEGMHFRHEVSSPPRGAVRAGRRVQAFCAAKPCRRAGHRPAVLIPAGVSRRASARNRGRPHLRHEVSSPPRGAVPALCAVDFYHKQQFERKPLTMSASREKKARQELNESGYVDPRKAREAEEKAKERRSTRIYTAVIVAFVLLGVVLFASGRIQASNEAKETARIGAESAVTIDGEDFSVNDVAYYYGSIYNTFANNGSSFGFDSSKSAREQQYTEGKTWHDYFLETALTYMEESVAVAHAAEAAGFDGAEQMDSAEQSNLSMIDLYASYSGATRAQYLTAMFGKYMTEEAFVRCVRRNALASAYQQSYSDSLTYSTADLQAAYDEDPDAYCSVDIEYVSFTTGLSSDATDAEKSAAMEEAKAKAEAVLAAYAEGRSFEESAGDGTYTHLAHADRSVTSDMLTWAFAADRTEGDTTVAEQSSGYVAVLFHSRSRDDYHPVTVRHILVEDEATAEEILADFKAGDATESDFAALASTKSTDSGTASNGGLVSNMRKGAYVQPFEDWSFDPSRQSGDTGIVESEYGFHVMYFVETNELPYWEYKATNTLKSSAVNDWYDAITDGVTAEQLDAIEYVG